MKARLARAEDLLATLALGGIMLLPLGEIAMRNLRSSGIPGSAAFALNLTAWVGMLGAAIAAREGKSFGLWKPLSRDRSLLDPARGYLEQVGLGPRAEDRVSELSHGERRQLELALALAQEASVLLLDEPMAGIGAEESARMTELLMSLKGRYAILLVEHDMDAVFALADRITVLVDGRVIATGAPDEIVASREVREAYLGDWSAGHAGA